MKSQVIRALGRQGDGVADGPVFVARALPGEEVTGDIVDGRIDQPKIVKPSDARVKPPCRHFKTCGGCQMQHASDAFLAEWKQSLVAEELQGAYKAFIASIEKIDGTASLGMRGRKIPPLQLLEEYEVIDVAMKDFLKVAEEAVEIPIQYDDV